MTTKEATAEIKGDEPVVVKAADKDQVTVRLAHFWTYQGKGYRPGDTVTLSPDLAAQVTREGYAAREA